MTNPAVRDRKQVRTMDHIGSTASTNTCGLPGAAPGRRPGRRASRVGGWLLAAALGLASASPAGAISILKAFAGDPSEGRYPYSGLVSDGAGNLYGTTKQGGAADLGTVFTVKADGTEFAVLHNFGDSDGARPYASLILDRVGDLYGTTSRGGASGWGTVFTVKTDGTGFAVLHSFEYSDSNGAEPYASLVLDGVGNLYGTTYFGGSSFGGTVFTLKTDGTGFAILHSFGHSDGVSPYASLVLDRAGNLYGTTESEGPSFNGTIFTLKADGTGFALLHSFAGGGSDGASPRASLVLDDAGNLFGTTYSGGSGHGTVFRVRTDGTGFAVLHSFGHLDGASPFASLVLDGAGNLYGTTYYGGASDSGTVFKVKADGTGFAVLRSLGGADGANPSAALVLDGAGSLYGTTDQGGASGYGTVFMLRTGGTGFAVLHSCTWGPSDGASPWAGPVLDGAGNLYGATYYGGASGSGTVFRVKTDGTGFAVLRSFGGSDGGNPSGALVLDGAGNLYGTTRFGGTYDDGTVFTLKTDGTGFAVLHSFGWSDGAGPSAGLILDGAGNLYGTTFYGGGSSYGTVFTLKTDGSGFALLHTYVGVTSSGAHPWAGLVLDGAGNLYGTTAYGGAADMGTVFALNVNGTGFFVLHSFVGGASDGAYPCASLVVDGAGNLYGTTKRGGASGDGTVFKLKTDGTSFALLRSFGGSDGDNPSAALVLDGAGNLWGTTCQGGASGDGTVFTLDTDGTGFAVLHSFEWFDGIYPYASLVVDGAGNLYGTTTAAGGITDVGTVFTLPVSGDPVFIDGFETGDTSAWSVTMP